MAEKKESGGMGITLIIILVVVGMAVWATISPAYLMSTLKQERAFTLDLGGGAADQWIYTKTMATSIEQLKDVTTGIKQATTLPSVMRDWVQNRILSTWLWGTLIMYRANMLLLYFFILMPFTFAIMLDGFWVREISMHRFSSQSSARHRFGVVINTTTLFAACLWLVIPIPIPSVVAPLAIIAVGFATWMWLSNLQKRI